MKNNISLVSMTVICVFFAAFTTPAVAQELRNGGKLLLTNGTTTIEGSSGGGLATWSVIAGNETKDGIGASAHVTLVEINDYSFQSHGISVGFYDRVEISYARQNLDTQQIGEDLGLGAGFTLDQDIYGAKLRVVGDVVYGNPLIPQLAVGVQHKVNNDAAIVSVLGAAQSSGTDYYVSATKLFLSHSILANGTVRYTNANQNGLLGFGGDNNDNYQIQFEGSLAYQLSRKLVLGAEYRSKPNNLSVAKEDDWFDIFAAYAVNRNITLTAAYVDLGSIATTQNQRGALFSLQTSF